MSGRQMQGELFKAETGWFHVFRSFVNSDAFASMYAKTVKVFLSLPSRFDGVRQGRAMQSRDQRQPQKNCDSARNMTVWF
jgi:hypothetical protein